MDCCAPISVRQGKRLHHEITSLTDMACCRDQKLTKKERAELDYKKEVLRLAKEKQRHLAEIEDKDVYRMPDSYEEAGAKRRNQQLDLLTARYQCAPAGPAVRLAPRWSCWTGTVLPGIRGCRQSHLTSGCSAHSAGNRMRTPRRRQRHGRSRRTGRATRSRQPA